MKKLVVVLKENVEPHKHVKNIAADQEQLFQQAFSATKAVKDENTVNLNRINESAHLKKLRNKKKRTYVVDTGNRQAMALLESLKAEDLVESMYDDEINYGYFKKPDDPLFQDLYAMEKIQVSDVWDCGFEGQDIIVAVVDSGIDATHPDLKDNLWIGPNGEHGFNAINEKADLADESGHGTHIAGTIAALVNNKIGVGGIAPKCRIMVIKALEGKTVTGSSKDLADGIWWAVDHGAHVINNSWGPGNTIDVKEAIEYANLNNVTVVFAAGNDDLEVSDASAAGNSMVISVGATDENDKKCNFSNHGNKVAVAAPGENILSTSPGAKYAARRGTSMAAPHVSGLAALAISKNRHIAPEWLKEIMVKNCDGTQAVSRKFPGRINAMKTINAIPALPQPGANKGAEVLKLPEARELLMNFFIPRWTQLTDHLTAMQGIPNPPELPFEAQHLAFRIETDELKNKVLDFKPFKVACILCINDKSTEVLGDDSVSIMFVGIGPENRPVTDAAIEKWRGIYDLVDLQKVHEEILTPALELELGAQEMAEFETVKQQTAGFHKVWNSIVEDIKEVNANGAARPNIMLDAPAVFFLDPGNLEGLLGTNNIDAIAGVLTFDSTPGNNFIAPAFVPIDVNNRPTGKLVQVRGKATFNFSRVDDVVGMLLTPMPKP